MNFDVLERRRIDQQIRTRIRQRDVYPQSIKNAQLAADFIKNTSAVQEDAVAVGNGAQLNITSTIASTLDDEIVVAIVPYMISLFEGSLTTANHIPFGSNVDNDLYRLYQTAIPQLTTIGNDGYNVVIKTACYNNTGGSKNIIVVTQARFITGVGGSVNG